MKLVQQLLWLKPAAHLISFPFFFAANFSCSRNLLKASADATVGAGLPEPGRGPAVGGARAGAFARLGAILLVFLLNVSYIVPYQRCGLLTCGTYGDLSSLKIFWLLVDDS